MTYFCWIWAQIISFKLQVHIWTFFLTLCQPLWAKQSDAGWLRRACLDSISLVQQALLIQWRVFHAQCLQTPLIYFKFELHQLDGGLHRAAGICSWQWSLVTGFGHLACSYLQDSEHCLTLTIVATCWNVQNTNVCHPIFNWKVLRSESNLNFWRQLVLAPTE